MTKGFFTGLLLGALVGAIGALMLAPMEGAETRNKVKTAAYNTRRRVGGIATGVQHKAHDTVDAIRQSI
ncbi:MAG: YtxH domain-containing protein [Armatimonadota bacterium]